MSLFWKKTVEEPRVLMSAVDALLRANDLDLKGLAEKAAAKASAISQQSEDLFEEAENISGEANKVFEEKLKEIQTTRDAAIEVSKEKKTAAEELAGQAETIENAIAAFEVTTATANK